MSTRFSSLRRAFPPSLDLGKLLRIAGLAALGVAPFVLFVIFLPGSGENLTDEELSNRGVPLAFPYTSPSPAVSDPGLIDPLAGPVQSASPRPRRTTSPTASPAPAPPVAPSPAPSPEPSPSPAAPAESPTPEPPSDEDDNLPAEGPPAPGFDPLGGNSGNNQSQNSGTQSPGTENSGTQSPGTENSGTQSTNE
jgi:hypothetical protein